MHGQRISSGPGIANDGLVMIPHDTKGIRGMHALSSQMGLALGRAQTCSLCVRSMCHVPGQNEFICSEKSRAYWFSEMHYR